MKREKKILSIIEFVALECISEIIKKKTADFHIQPYKTK